MGLSKRVFLKLIFGLLMGLFHLHAQESLPDFSFTHLTVDDGLSHTTVNTLLEDHLGMIWIGTRFGLNRYDGYEFKTFLPNDDHPWAIKGRTVLSLLEDKQGNIWIGHLNGGISVFERRTSRFIRFPFNDDASVNWETITVRDIFQDSQNRIWIGTFGGGALVFDEQGNRIAHYCTYCDPSTQKLANDFVFDFAEDAEGRIWIGTSGKGINVYDPKSDRILLINSSDANNMDGFGKSFCLGSDDNLWIGTAGNGLYEVDLTSLVVKQQIRSSNSAENGISHEMITDLTADKQGMIWIATDGGGLNRFNPQTNTWQYFKYLAEYPGSLNTDALYDIMFDRAGNLWIGTFNGGVNLHKVYSAPFVKNRKYAVEKSNGLRSVLSMDQDQNGQVWMGTDGAGLFRLDPNTNPMKLISVAGFPKQAITSLLSADEGSLWLGSFAQGLYFFREGKGILKHYENRSNDPQSLSHNNVWDLALDQNDGLWLGTLGGGVDYLAPANNSFVSFLPTNEELNSLSGSLSGVQVISIIFDENESALWVATENSGLNRIDAISHQITQYRHNPQDTTSLSSDHLSCLFQDKAGMIWIGTEYSGLNRLDPRSGEMLNFSIRTGFPSNMINSIVEDNDGFLWISTQSGIVRWDQKENRFINIGFDPYLQNNQYNRGAALKLTDGRLIFGSTNGYSMVLPDKIQVLSTPPRIVFTDFTLSGQSIPIGSYEGRTILNGPLNDSTTTIHLSYQDKGLNIKFAAIDYTQISQTRYAYRLNNFDAKWQYLNEGERVATYSGLPGGKYILQVKAANRDGNWHDIPKELTIIVDPPFWETWWFWGLMILLIIGIVIGIILFLLSRQKVRFQQQALEAEQEILRLQNENLEKDISNQRSKLSASVLQIAHKNEILNALKAQIQQVKLPAEDQNSRALRKLLREINTELKQENYWEQFQLIFDQTHTRFMDRLTALHSNLTNHEKRLCCFIRMGLSNREIASILNITINGVEQAKYRMKKKLEVAKEQSLSDYIEKIDM